MKKTILKLEENDLYASYKATLNRYNNQLTLELCQPLFLKLRNTVNFKSSEKFISTYYGNVVYNGEQLLTLETDISRLLLVKLADPLMIRFQNKESNQVVEDNAHNISDRQLAGLQYIAGYVISKLYKKIQKSNTKVTKAILEAAREHDEVITTNQKLVSALNRGGLWHVSVETQQIFVLAEKYFQRKTNNQLNSTLKINKIITDISSFSYVNDIMLKICEKVPDTLKVESNFKEIAKVTLFSMVQMYIRIRVFSLAKDFMQKHRMMKQQKSKEKSLRKTLKKQDESKVCC